MKKLLLLLAVGGLAGGTYAFSRDSAFDSCCGPENASCTPKEQGTCTACKNCSSCKHCKAGGKCSVCK